MHRELVNNKTMPSLIEIHSKLQELPLILNSRSILNFSILFVRSTKWVLYPLRLVAVFIFSREFKIVKNRIRLALNQNSKYPDIYLEILIAAEDRRFFSHCGIDLYAIMRSIHNNVANKKIQGASTIEQQLVRVILGRYELKIFRKLKEQHLALLLSSEFTKYEIAQAYLFLSYVGYFNKNLTQTHNNSDHAISLVARIRYPEPKVINEPWKYKIMKREDSIKKFIETKFHV